MANTLTKILVAISVKSPTNGAFDSGALEVAVSKLGVDLSPTFDFLVGSIRTDTRYLGPKIVTGNCHITFASE